MGIEMGTGRGVDVPAVVVALAFAVVDAYIYIYCAGLLKHYQVYAVLPDRLCKGDSDGDSRWLK